MNIILGATGHVGSAVANTLLKQGEPIIIITHDSQKASEWEQKGAQAAVVDVHDGDGLKRIFRQGKRLFLLNPPAAPSTDIVAEERKNITAILGALDGSGLEKIVAESTYGAQSGDLIGDLGVLYKMEQGLARMSIPTTIIRAAYYMSNWDASLQTAQQEGKVHALYPADFKLPMVAPDDIGQFAARFLTEPAEKTGLHYVEGPETYSPTDVAAAFALALNKPVEAVTTSREQWAPTLKQMGFSDKAAESMANMTLITVEKTYLQPDLPDRGATSLRSYIADVVAKSKKEK